MAQLVSYGSEVRFTILPYALDQPLQEKLFARRSDHVLGYVTQNKETGKRNFTYAESDITEAAGHWSLAVLKNYCEEEGPWIVYNCPPYKAKLEFGNLVSEYSQTLHIHDWDIWSVEEKDAKVAVITSWEMY